MGGGGGGGGDNPPLRLLNPTFKLVSAAKRANDAGIEPKPHTDKITLSK